MRHFLNPARFHLTSSDPESILAHVMIRTTKSGASFDLNEFSCIIDAMQTKKTYKVRIHGLNLSKTVFIVKSESHVDCYNRFSGIFKNRGYYNSRSSWNSYKFKDKNKRLLVSTSSAPAFFIGTNKTAPVRSYYFLPVEMRGARLPRSVRMQQELVLEVIELT